MYSNLLHLRRVVFIRGTIYVSILALKNQRFLLTALLVVYPGTQWYQGNASLDHESGIDDILYPRTTDNALSAVAVGVASSEIIMILNTSVYDKFLLSKYILTLF